MVMHSGRTDSNFNSTRSPLVQSVKHLETTKELIRTDKRPDFITMLDFPDDETRIAFCQCVDKCVAYGLREELDYIWNLGLSLVANRGQRAKMFSQTVAGLLVPEFYGGKGDVRGSNNGKKPNSTNE